MMIDFNKTGVLKIDMIEYIKNVLTELPIYSIGFSDTPAPSNLFKPNQTNPCKLNQENLISSTML
jgi:hypothetical protein